MPEPADKGFCDELVDERKIRVADDSADKPVSSDSAFECGSASGPEQIQNCEGRVQGDSAKGPEGSSSEPRNEAQSKNKRDAYQFSVAQSAKLAKAPYHGLLRHRVIIASCVLLSAVFLAISSVDLKELIERKAIFHTGSNSLEFKPPLPEPPANVDYNRNYGMEPQFNEGLCPVLESGFDCERVGYIDQTGKIVISPQFGEGSDFHEGRAAVRPLAKPVKRSAESNRFETPDPEPIGFINKEGKYVIKPRFDWVDSFNNGSAAVFFRDGVGGSKQCIGGLIDLQGNFLFKSKMREAPYRMGSLYRVTESFGKCGLINNKGQWIIKPEYDSIELFSDNWTDSDSPNSRYYFKVGKDRVCGVMDNLGNTLVPLKFDDISDYKNGFATVAVNDGSSLNFGFADSSGKILLEPKFDFASAYDQLIVARQNYNSWLLMDSKFNVLPNMNFDAPIILDGGWFSEGLAPVLVNGKVGFINTKGEMVIPPKYLKVFPFRDGVAGVFDGEWWRLIDRNGRSVTADVFTSFDSSVHKRSHNSRVYDGNRGGDFRLTGVMQGRQPLLFSSKKSQESVISVCVPGPFYGLTKTKMISDTTGSLDNWLESTTQVNRRQNKNPSWMPSKEKKH